MENASKALLIAGGIFIAIITLSILVILMNNIVDISNSQEEKRKTQELASWNAEWEAYNKGYLRGADVLTILNKAEQNNIDNKYNQQYSVNIVIKINGNTILNDQRQIEVSSRKTEVFKCVGISYNDETGRVSGMIFELEEI